jgi:dTDP-glucose pyrophosphorylase
MGAFLDGYPMPADRTKPWGTSHAILSAKDAVKEPFAVINADDFYGRDAFAKAYDFLVNECNDTTYALLGYNLLNTLSENGSVSRGVCEVDDNNNLIEINERIKVYQKDGQLVYEESDGSTHEITDRSKASMNFWCFAPSIFAYLEQEFKKFLQENGTNPKAEFLIPHSVDQFIRQGKGVVKVIPTAAKWFGVTYKEDAPVVKESLNNLVNDGAYPTNLWKQEQPV